MYKAIRYIGSKQKVLDFLEREVFVNLKENDSFFDGFSGTGIVSQYILEKNKKNKIFAGDISIYAKMLFEVVNIKSYDLDINFIEKYIEEFENSELCSTGDFFNEFSQNGKPNTYSESRLFFHELSGKTIDTFRYKIKKDIFEERITLEQSYIFLFYLLAYACKSANTTSVFGAYLKSDPKYKPFDLNFVKGINKELSYFLNNNISGEFYIGDIISNLEKLEKVDLIYLDPPYSTRRYESNYHILNYLVDLDFSAKDLKESKTGLPKEILDNPFSKKKETEIVFSDMIRLGVEKSNLLAISYNTDGLIKQSWIENFCLIEGLSLETKKMSYKRFKSQTIGDENQLEEIIWLIKKIN